MTEQTNKQRIDFNIILNAIAISLAFGYLANIAFYRLHLPLDYNVYVESTRGNFQGYYYPYWILAFVWPFAQLPYYLGYLLWSWLLQG